MAATIFALSGVPAPEGIDGKNLLPLLTNPAGTRARLAAAVQFLGRCSPRNPWRSSRPNGNTSTGITAREGMKPTEELFHLAQDRIEMANVAKRSPSAAELAAATQRLRCRTGGDESKGHQRPRPRAVSGVVRSHDIVGEEGAAAQAHQGQGGEEEEGSGAQGKKRAKKMRLEGGKTTEQEKRPIERREAVKSKSSSSKKRGQWP